MYVHMSTRTERERERERERYLLGCEVSYDVFVKEVY